MLAVQISGGSFLMDSFIFSMVMKEPHGCRAGTVQIALVPISRVCFWRELLKSYLVQTALMSSRMHKRNIVESYCFHFALCRYFGRCFSMPHGNAHCT